MGEKFLPCPLISHNSNSFSTSSLTSQSSLHSIPSLTPPSQTASYHHCLSTFKAHSSYIFSLTLAGKHLYTAASDGEIRVWDRNPNYPSQNYVISQGYSAVKSIVVLSNKLFTAHHDHKIRVWKINNSTTTSYHNNKLITTLPTVNHRCMRIFSAKSTWVHHNDAVSSLALSKDNSLLYSVSWDRTLKVWQTRDYKCVDSIQKAHDDAINDVISSNDGYVYTCSSDKKIKIWRKDEDSNKHSIFSTLEKHKSGVNALALSSDGCVLYSGACDRSIIVWEKDQNDGVMGVVGKLRGHKKAVLCLAVVEGLVCSGSADKTVRIWKRGSGSSYSCLAVLEGHNGPVKCLTIALDNNCSYGGDSECGNSYLVYSGGLDFDIKVWQIWVPS